MYPFFESIKMYISKSLLLVDTFVYNMLQSITKEQ